MPIFVNEILVPNKLFSGGESHVSLPDVVVSYSCQITAKLLNGDDIMQLLLTVDALRRINDKVAIELFIPYFPYARQDRVCNPGEAFSVEVIAGLINNLHCKSVTVLDPHSITTSNLLNNCKVVSQADIVAYSPLRKAIGELDLTLVSPDKGAEKKTKETQSRLQKVGLAVDIVVASKKRNPLGGEISEVHVDGSVAGKNLLILDDICDGGRTFIQLGKELKEKGANQIMLYVTHGIFSHGFESLKESIEHIYCYHELHGVAAKEPSYVTVMEREMGAANKLNFN